MLLPQSLMSASYKSMATGMHNNHGRVSTSRPLTLVTSISGFGNRSNAVKSNFPLVLFALVRTQE